MTPAFRRCVLAIAAACLANTAGSPEASAQRGLTDIPSPDAALELAALEPADGFSINLFAAEPDISKPIHMNFDAAGRLAACHRAPPML